MLAILTRLFLLWAVLLSVAAGIFLHYLAMPLAALPGALFSVWHNLSGSLLAGYWSGKSLEKEKP